MAADSAVMVIDAAKGVEAQTRKLFKVCAMRDIPIFTFINKMDREARDSFELLEELEKEHFLQMTTAPLPRRAGGGHLEAPPTAGPRRPPPPRWSWVTPTWTA